MEKKIIERISLKSIWKQLLEIINFERGIFYTIWKLIVSPGKSIRLFLFEDRSKLVKPFKFLIIMVAFVALIEYLFLSNEVDMVAQIEQSLENLIIDGDKHEKAEKVVSLDTHWQNLVAILSVPIVAFATWIVYYLSLIHI